MKRFFSSMLLISFIEATNCFTWIEAENDQNLCKTKEDSNYSTIIEYQVTDQTI